mmetsp:Transcript_5004/g.7339  ORF Transcript_5004/g.7339 Transcript_5004/m.7339 type:complete len:222 (-) Transcript_5004:157-822(-)|eukprot:CAMPEP_0116034556 /NCGR_PEP_ID=MMETSP0321-20121206/19692_1 /TAXON_ID=163516 /ORGANISM="Leptocylindrus danicus var. danicus, Strain B650" /LENGTH=221 /DNA_ID=CAMNT_0003510919 /DNA_START=86 /DNA_END=751 /DNA_ORIENTATION=-
MEAHATAAFNMLTMEAHSDDQVSIANHEDLLMLQSILSCDSEDNDDDGDSSSSSLSSFHDVRSRKVSSFTEDSSVLDDFSMNGESQVESSSAVDNAAGAGEYPGGSIIAQCAESSSDSISIEPMIQRVKSFADFIFEESFGAYSSEGSNHFMDDIRTSCISLGDDDEVVGDPPSNNSTNTVELTGVGQQYVTNFGTMSADPELVSNFDSEMSQRDVDIDME